MIENFSNSLARTKSVFDNWTFASQFGTEEMRIEARNDMSQRATELEADFVVLMNFLEANNQYSKLCETREKLKELINFYSHAIKKIEKRM